ncbi:MAG: GNAT family N-acetyltransferase [Rickettsiales bacterium]|jgi:putative hemolysin|nr:GNAT family N-acetyltransferase [Rickettsiales bacterium]
MGKYLDGLRSDRIEVRLARNDAEIHAYQRLRFKVFYEEEGAKPTAAQAAEKRDFDEYDPHSDHLIAIDRTLGGDPDDYIIGGYCLMRKEGASKVGHWYSQTEFDVEKFNDFDGEVLELRRACVAKDHRNKLTMQMLWNALAAYMFDYDIKLMFGCGSFLGTDPAQFKQALSYLYYNAVATGPLEIQAKGANRREMNMLPESEVDPVAAINSIPTMVRGYIRAGAKVSGSLWIDWDFNCFDVCIIFEMRDLKANYLKHYEKGIKG